MMKKYISPNSDIVSFPHFESAVVKIQDGREGKLSTLEKAAVTHLLLDREVEMEVSVESSTNSFASGILAKAGSKYQCRSKYMDLKFILPGSCIVESLFSIASYLFNDRRLSITPVHMEEQIFLKINRSLWNVDTVIKVAISK